MDKYLRHTQWVDDQVRSIRFATITVVVFALAVVTVALILSSRFVRESRDTVYVVDGGSTVMATMARGDAQREEEIEDHITRFHELMFNLAPSKESHDRRFEAAFNMADRSAYEYWNDQNETGYYSRLISANISQEILIDSVKFTTASYPYPALCYGKVQLVRESNISRFDFVSRCQLRDVARSRQNPHGLLVEKFEVTRYENIGTRRRR